MKRIILASTSKYRKELLKRLGLEFECIAPLVDEDIYKGQIPDLVELAEKLGFEKCQAIALKNPEALVIGSDQIAECDGKTLSKAGNEQRAFEQLRILNGQEHRLITSFTVFYQGQFYTRTNITKLKMRQLSESQIRKYLSLDTPFDCAGSYKLELNGISLFEKITTDDHSAIIGLPLIELGNLMNQIGFSVPPEKH